MKNKKITISRDRAIEIVMAHNGVSRDMAERYTPTEFKETLKHACFNTVIKLDSFGVK